MNPPPERTFYLCKFQLPSPRPGRLLSKAVRRRLVVKRVVLGFLNLPLDRVSLVRVDRQHRGRDLGEVRGGGRIAKALKEITNLKEAIFQSVWVN
jgi:hypothetical protein